MSEPAVQVQAIMATPACMQPRRTPVEACPPRRATARQLLEAALAGVRLGCRDQQFLSRLVHWDKRNATSVASLLDRARQAGREAGIGEAGLTQRQRELIIGALGEAAVYRASGAAAASCWDCDIVPGGRCAEHVRDFDRAGAYADLARVLAGTAPGPAEPCTACGGTGKATRQAGAMRFARPCPQCGAYTLRCPEPAKTEQDARRSRRAARFAKIPILPSKSK